MVLFNLIHNDFSKLSFIGIGSRKKPYVQPYFKRKFLSESGTSLFPAAIASPFQCVNSTT